MPNLSIKNVPHEVLDKLRERASRHHRSLQGELMALLSAALELQASGGEPHGAQEVPNNAPQRYAANRGDRRRASQAREEAVKARAAARSI